MNTDSMHALLEQLPVGVVGMGRDSEVLLYNRYEEQLAGRSRQSVLGKRFFAEVAPCTQVARLEERFLDGVSSGKLSHALDFRFTRPHLEHPRDVHLQLLSAPPGSPFAGLLLVQDVSSIRAIERTKDFLVRTLAHDMSSPLSATRVALELLGDAQCDAEREKLVKTSLRSMSKLREMVQNLYDVTRLHTSDVELRYARIDLGSFLHDLAEERRPMARHSGLHLECDAGAGIEAEVDEGLVRRAVGNLLDNALAYTPDGGRVLVRLAAPGSHVFIDVEDSGPGIPAEQRQWILQPFTRGDAPHSDSTQHQGLGLALVELVAREHGGQVQVFDAPEGGSLFRLMLPTGRPASE